MSAELFVRSYPAKGAEIVPVVFGAGTYAYALLLMAPVAAIAFFVIVLHNISPRPDGSWPGLLISIVAFSSVLALLRRLRLEIRMDGISYTSFFRNARFVAYPDISSIVVIDYREEESHATPQRSVLSRTAIVTPKVETRKPPMKISLTFFPYAAYREFVRLFKPEVWESGT